MQGRGGKLQDTMYWMGKMSRTLKIDVICFPFRGFTQSEGTPTDAGVLKDSEAIFQYAKKIREEYTQIYLWGKSLGCAVAISGLCQQTKAS